MARQVILISFGSMDAEARKTMERLERKLMEISPMPVNTAYLYHGNKLNCMDNKDSLLMPLLVQKGSEYKKILSYGFKTGEPLLSSSDDAEKIAKTLGNALPRQHGTKYMILAHGSASEKVAELETLKELLREDMIMTTLQGKNNYMTIELPDEEDLVIVPFMLSTGHHTKIDIKNRIIPLLKEKGKKPILIEKGLLDLDPAFTEIFIDHLKKLIN